MKLVLIAAWMTVLTVPATAQTPQKVPPSWQSGSNAATAKASGISIPLKAGTLTNFALRDAKNDGADVAAQFESPDGKILGTIFIYAPTRPDPALTFLATDEAIMRRFGTTAQRVEDALVPAAGVEAGARRVIYTGIADSKLSGDPNGRIYSGAALIRAGEWMMKIRVSGPISRSTEIGRNLDLLVAGLSFDKNRMPFPQTRIVPTDCAALADRPSITIDHPAMADALALNIMLDPDVVDEKSVAIVNPLMPSIDGLCREEVEIKDNIALQLFRVTSRPEGRFVLRRTLLYGDAGVMLLAFEDTRHPGRFFLSRHDIGHTYIFGRTNALPNNAELRALLFNPADQPSIVSVTRDHLTDETNVVINCSLTIEGCAKK